MKRLLAILFSLLLGGCVYGQKDICMDSNLLFLPFFIGLPTINFETKGELEITRIDYKDIAKGIIDYGDDDSGFIASTVYNFDSYGRIITGSSLIYMGKRPILPATMYIMSL